MSDFQDKLNSILADPDSLNQIMELAKKLGQDNSAGAASDPVPDYFDEPAAQASAEPTFNPTEHVDNEPVFSAPAETRKSGIDPSLIGGIMQVLGNVNTADERQVNLINALKPYLKDDRQERLDKAIMVAQLAKMARSAMQPPENK